MAILPSLPPARNIFDPLLAHTHPPLARGGRVVCLLCSPSQPSQSVSVVVACCARFHEFPQLLAVASSPSPAERAAFMAFALQRIRAVSLKGTCAIILARPVSRTAPGGVHRRGALPLIQPKPRPRAAAFVSPPPRPQPRAAWAGAFPDAPPPWAPLAVPAPVAPPPHRAPQMPGLSRNGAPLPSPTPHVNIAERPPQPPLR